MKKIIHTLILLFFITLCSNENALYALQTDASDTVKIIAFVNDTMYFHKEDGMFFKQKLLETNKNGMTYKLSDLISSIKTYSNSVLVQYDLPLNDFLWHDTHNTNTYFEFKILPQLDNSDRKIIMQYDNDIVDQSKPIYLSLSDDKKINWDTLSLIFKTDTTSFEYMKDDHIIEIIREVYFLDQNNDEYDFKQNANYEHNDTIKFNFQITYKLNLFDTNNKFNTIGIQKTEHIFILQSNDNWFQKRWKEISPFINEIIIGLSAILLVLLVIWIQKKYSYKNKLISQLESENSTIKLDLGNLERRLEQSQGRVTHNKPTIDERIDPNTVSKQKHEINKLQLDLNSARKEIELKNQEVKSSKDRIANLESNGISINREKDNLNREITRLNEKEIYPDYLIKIRKDLKSVYHLLSETDKKMISDNVFKKIVSSALMGQNPQYSPSRVYDFVRENDFILEIMGLRNVSELKNIDKKTFFDKFFKSYYLINLTNIAQLYAYSKAGQANFNIRAKLQNTGANPSLIIEVVDRLMKTIKDEFDVSLIVPGLLEKYDSFKYEKISVSVVREVMAVELPGLADGLIYDISRIGFEGSISGNIKPKVAVKES